MLRGLVRSSRIITALLATVSLLLVVACGGGTPATPTAPSTPTVVAAEPSPTPGPSPTPTTVPTPAMGRETTPTPPTVQNEFRAGDLRIKNVWARAALQIDTLSAVYMVIENSSHQPDRLISASTDVAGAVELHETKLEQGVMKMLPVSAIEIPARGQVELRPGGLHVMLIGLRQDLVAGRTLQLTLRFEQAGEVTVQAVILEPQAIAPTPAMSHGNGMAMATPPVQNEFRSGPFIIRNVWARAATQADGVSAVYMVIENTGDQPDRLLHAHCDAAQTVELHESKMEGGVMKMQQVNGIDVPAHSSVQLKPGGLHVMLIGLTRDLKPGDTLDLELHFEQAGHVEVQATVVKP